MTINRFVRCSAILGIIGFAITVVSVIINIVSDAESLVGSYLNIFGLILVMLGFIAAYLCQTENLGAFGFFSFIILLVANALTVGTVVLHSIAFPVINDLQPSMDINNLANNDLPSPMNQVMMVETILGIVGAALFGLVVLFKSKIMRWAGLLLLIAAVCSVVGFAVDLLSFIGFVLILVVALWMSIKVLVKKDAA